MAEQMAAAMLAAWSGSVIVATRARTTGQVSSGSVSVFLGVSDSLWLAWAVSTAGGAILLAGCGLTLRRRRRRGRGMLLGGLFPMVAAGFFSGSGLALTTLGASAPVWPATGLPDPGRRLRRRDGPDAPPPAS
jgi:hypothetical protein